MNLDNLYDLKRSVVRKAKNILDVDIERGSFFSIYVYTFAGTVSLHEHFEWNKSPALETGRRKEKIVRIPIGKYDLQLSSNGKDTLKLVEGPAYLKNLHWILDEFDSSFNDLATASLKYHLDFSICDNEIHREKFESIIARLQEEEPDVIDSPEKQKVWDDHYGKDLDGFFKNANKPRSDEMKAISADYHKRCEEWTKRRNQARHDFVDIMPYLWS